MSYFKKLSVLLALVLSTSFSAQASEIPFPLSDFDKLADWFQQASPVHPAEFRGAFSGRCFVLDDKYTPQNILIGYRHPYVEGIIVDNVAADYFDHQTDETIKGYFDDVYISMIVRFTYPSFEDTLTYYAKIGESFREKYEIRSYKGYYIQKITSLAGNGMNPYTDKAFKVAVGQPSMYCFFHKKLQ